MMEKYNLKEINGGVLPNSARTPWTLRGIRRHNTTILLVSWILLFSDQFLTRDQKIMLLNVTWAII
jgi:hypothetical protein